MSAIRITAFLAVLTVIATLAVIPPHYLYWLRVDRGDHVLAFLVLTQIGRGLWPAMSAGTLAGMMTALGIALEGFQWIVPTGHSAEWLDMTMNLAGIALAFPLSMLLKGTGGRLSFDRVEGD